MPTQTRRSSKQAFRELGAVRDYTQFHAVLRALVAELGITRATLDDLGGWANASREAARR